MKVLYDPNDGKIYYAVPDRDWFYFEHTTNITLETLEVDELPPDNKFLCCDLIKSLGKVDAEGGAKYLVSEGALMEKEGWKEEEHVRI